jgi:hypothetical protein
MRAGEGSIVDNCFQGVGSIPPVCGFPEAVSPVVPALQSFDAGGGVCSVICHSSLKLMPLEHAYIGLVSVKVPGQEHLSFLLYARN